MVVLFDFCNHSIVSVIRRAFYRIYDMKGILSYLWYEGHSIVSMIWRAFYCIYGMKGILSYLWYEGHSIVSMIWRAFYRIYDMKGTSGKWLNAQLDPRLFFFQGQFAHIQSFYYCGLHIKDMIDCLKTQKEQPFSIMMQKTTVKYVKNCNRGIKVCSFF